MKNKWTYKFEEYGGYDCMTDAYYIYNCNGKTICNIDLNDYTKEKAKKIAKLIVDSVNKELTKKRKR